VDDAAANTFMNRTRSSGLPNTLVIDRKGRLAWVGAPSMGFDDALSEIIDGSWDIDRVARDDRIRHKADVFIGKASAAERSGEYQTAIDLIEQAVVVDPSRFSLYRGWQYEIALARLSDGEQAREVADRLLNGPQGDEHFPLFILATRVVVNLPQTPAELQDLDLALRCAEKAVEINPEDEYDYLALLAQVHALRRDYSAAVEVQRKAMDVVSDSDRASAAGILEEYQTRTGGK
jgi:tetratricopeptide (TPR) repeat protein